jgi:AcrR family transcriptional regulator
VAQTLLIGRTEILDAALRVADKHGLDAVSMYAVALQLRVEPAALLRHVDGTSDLLDGLVEMMLTRYPLTTTAGAWDARLIAMAAAIRETARRHPAVFPLLLTRPVVTPAARAVRDAVLDALRDGGVPESSVYSAERLISTAVLGFAVSEAAGRFRMHTQNEIDADFAELLRWLLLSLAGLVAGQCGPAAGASKYPGVCCDTP